jgi:hypothetical protein
MIPTEKKSIYTKKLTRLYKSQTLQLSTYLLPKKSEKRFHRFRSIKKNLKGATIDLDGSKKI